MCTTFETIKARILAGLATASEITSSCLSNLEKNVLLNLLAEMDSPCCAPPVAPNLVGPVTSIGIVTSIASGAITSSMVAAALTGKSVNGVTLVSGGSASNYLDASGNYSAPSPGNLTGPVTSVGLATSIANAAITSAMVAAALTGKSVNGVTLVSGGSAALFLDAAGNYSAPPGTINGTVTAVTAATANGVSATVANQGTTPELTFTLGAITPSSVASAGAISGTVLTLSGDALINGVTMGRGAGSIATNTAIGFQALFSNTTGTDNTAIGYTALTNNTTGIFGVAVGAYAGRFIADGVTAATVVNSSIFVGYNARPLADSQTNQTVIGHAAVGLGSNSTVINNSSVQNTEIRGNGLHKLLVTGAIESTTFIRAGITAGGTLVLPATAGVGAEAWMNDSTIPMFTTPGGIAVAGGANVCKVYSDGTDWRRY